MSSHDPLLGPLAEVPPPRRTDAAFARGVMDGVKQRRSRRIFVVPALAAAGAAFALVALVRPTGPARDVADAGTPQLAKVTEIAEADLPFAFVDDDGLFAIPAIDGSSDEELARLDRALDTALAARGVSP
jgi:hypothetical protein